MNWKRLLPLRPPDEPWSALDFRPCGLYHGTDSVGLQLMAVFEHCQRELTANSRSQHISMDVTGATGTRGLLRDSV